MKNLNKRGEEINQPYEYLVDKVFNFNVQTGEVFDEASDLIAAAAEGSTTYVFAYGQTGTGKTHTLGGNTSDFNSTNILKRASVSSF